MHLRLRDPLIPFVFIVHLHRCRTLSGRLELYTTLTVNQSINLFVKVKMRSEEIFIIAILETHTAHPGFRLMVSGDIGVAMCTHWFMNKKKY